MAPEPGSSFYSRPEVGRHPVRFAFYKTLPMLEEAARRLTGVAAASVRARG